MNQNQHHGKLRYNSTQLQLPNLSHCCQNYTLKKRQYLQQMPGKLHFIMHKNETESLTLNLHT